CTIRVGKDVSRGYLAEDFSEALGRYVPKADFDARMQEMHQRHKLWTEVKAEEDAEWHTV
ncbi:MAG TPA: hypothetical protein VNV43_14165, partial [Candidatus Acidoferrales bacterium]|nr:hypothetical protein [Candidatus Acidoferrales bacterium]